MDEVDYKLAEDMLTIFNDIVKPRPDPIPSIPGAANIKIREAGIPLPFCLQMQY